MKSNYYLILALVLFATINSFGQSKIELKSIIDGKWNIENRGSMVTLENPDGGENKYTNSELIQSNSKQIEFKSGTYTIDSEKNGKFVIKGSSIYLDDKKYQFGIFDKDKFNLIRIVSKDYLLTYMLTRKVD